MSSVQSSNTVLMVSPLHFCLNMQAAADNHFMSSGDKLGLSAKDVSEKALIEFNNLVSALRSHGVDVNIFHPSPPKNEDDLTPDAVFPNNWFSAHAKGETEERMLILYPMKVPNRRGERRQEIINDLEGTILSNVVKGSLTEKPRRFNIKVDLTYLENEGIYLEGTGSLVLDRVNKVVYASISERTHLVAVEKWARITGYKSIVSFAAFDSNGKSVYHTNVIMAIGTGWAVVCADSVKDEKERAHLLAALSKHHSVITISLDQVNSFCGNVLELLDSQNRPIIAMSTRAHDNFTNDQRAELLRHVHALVHCPIEVIESVGGGGVRCTLGEIL